MIRALLQASTAEHPVRFAGVTLVGVNQATLTKVLLTIGLVILIALLSRGARWILRLALPGTGHEHGYFWGRQAIRIISAALLVIAVLSVWFDDPARLTSVIGLVSAGIAIALQRVVTSFAAYVIILRGRVFNVGDRITIGGVRGDVVALDFMQTTVMEMGQSKDEQGDAPSMWVHGRQYTGRLVRVTNDKLFDNPIYNFTREYPYLWEEIRLWIAYRDDQKRVEQILLDVGRRHTQSATDQAKPAFAKLVERYRSLRESDLEPRVYWRLTDNWVELTLRFVVEADRVRAVKDAMSRDIIPALAEAGIGMASSTFELTGLPTLRITRESSAHPS